MRLAFVSLETAHHRDSETNQRLRTIFELLTARGHDIHCYCTQFWAGDESTHEYEDVTYHAVSSGPEARSSFLARLPFVLAAANPDVIHASAQPPGQVLAARVGATLSRTPLVVEWYGDDGVPETRWTRLAAGRPDGIIAPSQLVATWTQELGADGDVVDVIPNPIDCDRVQDVDPGEDVDVIYARRLDGEANLESLLLGLAELRGRDWQATVIGDGPERDAYESLAADLRIDERVRFVGDLELDERIAAYRGAHVFAQTADRCVFPTEMLWALAAGCVGIVEYHTNSSAHELVEGWERGFRTTSEEELAEAILAAGDLEKRTYDDRFAAYDRSTVAEQYLERYRTLQADHGLL